MNSLSKPKDSNGVPFSPGYIFSQCIRSCRPELRERLESIQSAIAAAERTFETAAENSTLHCIEPHGTIGIITKQEMMSVYSGKFVPEGQDMRLIYERIRNAPKYLRCPLCGVGYVKTLDHHLPKSNFPSLSVCPTNLIPSCEYCQTEKKDAYPTIAEEQTIHPYFDDFNQDVWLHAEVIETSPASFRFSAKVPRNWSKLLEDKLNNHIKVFGLQKLYVSNAGSELAGMRKKLKRNLDSGGISAVRDHLFEEIDSLEEVSKNSWRAAMYRGAASSAWFCGGGFDSQ